MAVEENISKVGSFGISNIQYTEWFCDFILCYLGSTEPIKLL